MDLQEVYFPLITNARNQEGWPEVTIDVLFFASPLKFNL
jgi:hypothetical protein